MIGQHLPISTLTVRSVEPATSHAAPKTLIDLIEPAINRMNADEWGAMRSAMGKLAQTAIYLRLKADRAHDVVSFDIVGTGNGLELSLTASTHLLLHSNTEEELRTLTSMALKNAGHWSFIQSNADKLISDEHGVDVTIQYFGNRKPEEASDWHQDDTLFTSLIYFNEDPIPGPEIMLNPVVMDPATPEMLLREHLGEAPPSVFEEFRDFYYNVQHGAEQQSTQIPPHGMIGFINALCFHASPFPHSRGVELEELADKLPAYFRDVMRDPLLAGVLEREREGGDLSREEELYLKTSWQGKLGQICRMNQYLLDREIGRVYKADLLRFGFNDVEAEKLLNYFGSKSLDKVQVVVREAGERRPFKFPITDRYRTLTRRMSECIAKESAAVPENKKPRAFLAVLVNVYRRDLHKERS